MFKITNKYPCYIVATLPAVLIHELANTALPSLKTIFDFFNAVSYSKN